MNQLNCAHMRVDEGGTYLDCNSDVYVTEPKTVIEDILIGRTIQPDTFEVTGYEAEHSSPPKQIGGTHYETPIQPIEFIEANNLNFHEANIIKYVSRYKQKNGIEDLRKAAWYLDRLISLQEQT